MKPIVVKAADADSIARHWGDLRHVDRLRGGEVVVLDVSALTGVTAAFEAFFVALDRHVAARAARLEAVTAMQRAGIINGMGDGTFGPARSATRAQAATMLARFYRAVKE